MLTVQCNLTTQTIKKNIYIYLFLFLLCTQTTILKHEIHIEYIKLFQIIQQSFILCLQYTISFSQGWT